MSTVYSRNLDDANTTASGSWHPRDGARPYTNLANLPRSTIHVAAAQELTSKSEFAKRAVPFANLPSLQTRPAVAPFLTISRALTPMEKTRLLVRRLHTNLANLVRPTIHVAAAHELTSKSEFAKRAVPFANLPSLQTCPAVAPFLTVTISRAPTSLVRSRAQFPAALFS